MDINNTPTHILARHIETNGEDYRVNDIDNGEKIVISKGFFDEIVKYRESNVHVDTVEDNQGGYDYFYIENPFYINLTISSKGQIRIKSHFKKNADMLYNQIKNTKDIRNLKKTLRSRIPIISHEGPEIPDDLLSNILSYA